MKKRGFIGLIGMLLFHMASLALANDPQSSDITILRRYHPAYLLEVNRFFIVRQLPVDVFASATAETPEPDLGTGIPVGKVYFATQENGTRVLLGEYRETPEKAIWTQLGWVEKAKLLVDRMHPLTVGEAIQSGLQVRRSDAAGGLSPQNALYLRCVTHPERLLKPMR